MTDTQKQKQIIRGLLELTDENGRGYYPLAPLAAAVGLTVQQLYDNNTNTGLLWSLGRFGEGMIEVLPPDYTYAAINRDCQREAEMWVRDVDYEPSEAAMRAAEAINTAWRWDIPLSEVAAIIDRECDVQMLIEKCEAYEKVLITVRDSDDQTPFAIHMAACEVLECWE